MITVDTEQKMLPMGVNLYVIGASVGFLVDGVTGLAVGTLSTAVLMWILQAILMLAAD